MEAAPTTRLVTPGRLWVTAYALLAFVTGARLPVISEQVRAQIEHSEVAAEYAQLEQAGLAVQVGTSTALVIVLASYLLLFVGARAFELRVNVPARRVAVGSVALSLPFVTVASVTIAMQAVMLALGVVSPRTDVRVWLVAAVAAVLSAAITTPSPVRGSRFIRNAGFALLFAAACFVV